MSIKKQIEELMDFKEDRGFPSNPPMAKLKPQPRPCEYCNRIVDRSNKVQHRQVFVPYRYWQTKCLDCNFYWNEEEKTFNFSNLELREFIKQRISTKKNK